MPQDAPADTAGPSSPPPQLPDGWLPQWEGVQRKWYFVQRATGKSQWEIPTEPVVLTPSSTPTSIGTGPTYPPSRPSTNSPQVIGTGNTLAGRIEPVASSARISSSLDAQLHGLDRPTHGSSETPEWYPSQTSQQIPHGYRSQFVPGDGQYGVQPYQKYGPSPSSFYPNQGNIQPAVGQQLLVGDPASMQWDGNATAAQAHAGGYTPQQPQGPHPRFPVGPQHAQPLANNLQSTMAQNHLPGLTAVPPPQPQWHPSQQPLVPSDAASTGFHSAPSQPLYGSYPTPQTAGASPRDFPSRPSQSSNPSLLGSDFTFTGENSQSIHGSLSMRSHSDIENVPMGSGYPMSRTNSQQTAVLPPQGSHAPGAIAQSPHGYQQHPPSPHGQYQTTNMSRTQSGTAYNPTGYSATPESQSSAHNYQNPLAQAGMHQYLPSAQHASYTPGGSHLTGSGHSLQTGTPPGYQNQWETAASIASRSAASDPQFVSGPWASTPPSSGPQQPPRYE